MDSSAEWLHHNKYAVATSLRRHNPDQVQRVQAMLVSAQKAAPPVQNLVVNQILSQGNRKTNLFFIVIVQEGIETRLSNKTKTVYEEETVLCRIRPC